jgi:hypothetical protein
MRAWWTVVAMVAVSFAGGCSRGAKKDVTMSSLVDDVHAGKISGVTLSKAGESQAPDQTLHQAIGRVSGGYIGFDRNEYPGDETMAAMKQHFAFMGYWLTNPPGDRSNNWVDKREVLKRQGWGFLLLANGKLEAKILKAQKAGTAPADLAKQDAAEAVAAARREGFPAQAIVFLDQEEGGRLTDVQAAYLLAWTEAVAASAYRPGVYASGQPVEDGPGKKIDTIEDIRARVKAGSMHAVAMFDAQDTCGPSTGCTLSPPALDHAGEPDLMAWQYSQSPRRPEITKSCAKTYAADGNCYAPGFPAVFLDMDLAKSADPSGGR